MNKQNSIVFILFTFLSFFTTKAQVYDDFDLSTYITPDIVRNSLDFNVNSLGYFNAGESSELDYRSISGDLAGDYKRIKNTRPFIGEQQLFINTIGGLSKGDPKNNYKVEFRYNNSATFYNKNKEFFSIGGSVSGSFEGKKTESTQETQQKSQRYYSVSLPIGIGKGRIEDVTDARQAIYILDNLNKKNVLTRKLNEQEIFEFARLISKVKNKRFLDARLHMIEEISSVDSFLVINELQKSAGASYFTTLYDYWMYGDRFKRYSGKVISFTVTPELYHRKNKYTNIESTNNSISLSNRLGFACHKPLNLYWQRESSIGLNADYNKYNYSFYDNDIETYRLYIDASYSWGYFPNSRTNINWGGYTNLGWAKDNLNKGINARGVAFFNTYYYLSPQLRIAATADLGFKYDKMNHIYPDELRWDGNFNLTLTYSLF